MIVTLSNVYKLLRDYTFMGKKRRREYSKVNLSYNTHRLRGEITFTREIKAPTAALVVYLIIFRLLRKILIENI